VVINATGPWTDELRSQVGAEARIRKLRGSHLFFPYEKLPLPVAITLLHPRDHRALFVFPWEGVTLIGTTDLDHPRDLEALHPEPVITPAEVTYLMEAADFLFPESHLTTADIQSSIAGLRPIVTGGAADPSKESRAHVLFQENGLLTITGGKLTAYRRMAYETLEKAKSALAGKVVLHPNQPLFTNPVSALPAGMSARTWNRLKGRYSADAAEMADACPPDEWAEMDQLPALWGEIRWGARAEGVVHLDDLLLRRTRLGLTAPHGGLDWMPRIRELAQPELGWSDDLWADEEKRYAELWHECYDIPKTA
jgi:glycerol-3-phosphate dehydrogenase